ncbi:MAG TPA: hypothetical protein VFM97_09600 [Gammaproteobacteria bacterium]|nr:hypothetical protein [Gammaproteobacteria bacterium]
MKFTVVSGNDQMQDYHTGQFEQVDSGQKDAEGKAVMEQRPVMARKPVRHVTAIPAGETASHVTTRLDLQIVEPSDEDVLLYRPGRTIEIKAVK